MTVVLTNAADDAPGNAPRARRAADSELIDGTHLRLLWRAVLSNTQDYREGWAPEDLLAAQETADRLGGFLATAQDALQVQRAYLDGLAKGARACARVDELAGQKAME